VVKINKLYGWILENKPFLLKKTLEYAKQTNYVKYTATLEESWVASINGLSDALLKGIITNGEIPELSVDSDFINNPLTIFGITEARLHRQRGVTLEMFLGLMKYYRQPYLDLIAEKSSDRESESLYSLWVNRFFDHNEIAFCSEWTRDSQNSLLDELQSKNRDITNEKNKYLTIFKSIPTPVIILDTENRCNNMNYAAIQLLQNSAAPPGYIYSSEQSILIDAETILPWLTDEFHNFINDMDQETTIEKDIDVPGKGRRNLSIRFHRILDVSGKFEGTVIILTDLTEWKEVEVKLRYLSFNDSLTGLYNRAYFEEEFLRMGTGRFGTVGVISGDVDGLKLVNDTLGHQAGDALLILAGTIMVDSVRKSDVVARVGGDEFAILMPNIDPAEVEILHQRIVDKINRHNQENLSMPISISLGCAVGDSRSSNISNILRQADNQMYLNKSKNRGEYPKVFNDRLVKYGLGLFKTDVAL